MNQHDIENLQNQGYFERPTEHNWRTFHEFWNQLRKTEIVQKCRQRSLKII